MGFHWKGIQFWHLMVGTGLVLVVIGLLLILVPNELGARGVIVLEVFGAKFEGTEMGLALIVLGLACFLIGQKDRADIQKYRSLQKDLQKTSKITARLVGNNVQQKLASVPGETRRDFQGGGMDIGGYEDELDQLQDQKAGEREGSYALRNAERGLELLEELEKQGYSYKPYVDM